MTGAPAAAASRTALLVLGMHRSGTSAVARVLNLLGADLGHELLPPREDNRSGFWENRAFVRLHEELLDALGRRWHDAAPLPAGWLDSDAARRFREALARELDAQFADSALIAIKDPRLSLVLPAWMDVLDRLGWRTVSVVVNRHPQEVAASLAARDGFPAEKSVLLWALHVLDAERGCRDRPRVIVDYDELLADWRAAVARIADAAGLAWPISPSAVAAEVAAFIDPSARHHRAAETAEGQAMPDDPVASIRDLCRRWRAGEAALAASFDAARDRLERSLRLPGAVIVDLESRLAALQRQYTDEVAAARRVVEAKDAELAVAAQVVADKNRELAVAREVIAAKDAELDRARDHNTALAAQVAEARSTIDGLVGDVAVARDAIAAKDAELDRARDHNTALAAQVAAARTTVDGLVGDVAVARDTIAAKDAELDRARDHNTALAAQVSEARTTIDGLVGDVAVARDAIAAKDAELAEARRAHAARDEREAVLRGEIAARDATIEAASQREAALRTAFDAALQEIAAARGIAAGKDAEIDAARQTIDGLVAQIDAARVAFGRCEAEIAGARTTIAAKDTEIDAARQTIDALMAQIAAAREVIAGKDTEIDAARRTIDQLVAEIDAARRSIAAAVDETAQVQRALAEAQATRDRWLDRLQRLQALRWVRLGRRLRLMPPGERDE